VTRQAHGVIVSPGDFSPWVFTSRGEGTLDGTMRQGKHGRALRLGSRHSRVIANSAVAIDRRIPLRVIIYSAVASLAGSVAAVQIATVGEVTSSVLVGSLAGLFAGTLMGDADNGLRHESTAFR